MVMASSLARCRQPGDAVVFDPSTDPLPLTIPPFPTYYIRGKTRWKIWWSDGGMMVENGGTAEIRHFQTVDFHHLEQKMRGGKAVERVLFHRLKNG
jgi:hypothetical protein